MPTIPLDSVRIAVQTQPDRMYFRCPECGGTDLEEVARCIQYACIGGFYRYNNGTRYFPDWYDSDYDDHNTLRVQCRECGFMVSEGMPENLYQHCLDEGWIVTESEIESQVPFLNNPAPNREPTWEV